MYNVKVNYKMNKLQHILESVKEFSLIKGYYTILKSRMEDTFGKSADEIAQDKKSYIFNLNEFASFKKEITDFLKTASAEDKKEVFAQMKKCTR